ncbi:DUF4179 domain-containing protein [Brevibacillus sp. HB2.2]|uniref:DUF4179 domain-containing protein n=1 Tax=Brevibacillus sp. HB2.2 TaxID=2738846 RepID=UPI00156ABAEB|nr:DUF5643 domain-containing protein [Brevibacillus sp. HB2.2]NRS50195.1 DUF4179 domain-containing protein [Brevibacillus sp. HB2.2]
MKCFMFNQWKLYANGELPPAASKGLEQHAVECPQCQIKLQEWVDHMLKEEFSTYPEVPVPDTFTDEVMRKLFEAVPARTARKHSSRTRRQRGWDIVKKTGLVVAGLTALVVTGTVVSPTFANYVNSLFQIEKDADSGMKNAVNKGLVQKLEQKVTDQGITFEAKELMADSMRIAIIFDMYDQNGKQIEDHSMKLQLIDSNGKDWLAEDGSEESGSNHGQFFITEVSLNDIFESAEATPEQLTLKIVPTDIEGKTGKWDLEIPVDMKKAKEATKTVAFKDAVYQSPQGLELKLKQIEFSPSATRVMLDSTVPKSAYVEFERAVLMYDKEHPGGVHITNKKVEPTLSGGDIAYEITNEKGEVVAARDMFVLDEGIAIKKNVLYVSGLSSKQEGDIMKWWHTFGPLQGEQKLKFQLQKVYENKLASPKFDLIPEDLNKKAATFKDETGSSFTFSSFSWTPASGKEKGKAVITVEGTLGKDVVSIKYWYVKDENGKIYYATLRPESTRDKDGRVLVKGELVIPKLEQVPKKLTICYPEYTVEHHVNWEVPFEIK